MTNETQQFYFDEAGYTGNNLLDPEQPVFVYAGVAMDSEHASELRSETLSRFRINALELKGANLLKRGNGRKAISWLLAESSQYSHVMVANKEYALTGKFFEYIIEPALAQRNSLFYTTGFHKFIATLLHVCHSTADPHVNKALKNFTEMMRSVNPEQLGSVLSPLGHFDQSNPLGMVFAFTLCHQNLIVRELEVMKGSNSVAKWPLELSMTALHWLLASWGEEFKVLDVYCDESKPVQEARHSFDAFIGREDKLYLEFGNLPSPFIGYNLAGPINLVDSKMSSGVQIADVLSSTLAYAYKNPDEETAKEWIDILKDVPANLIIPDMDDIDLKKRRTFVNTKILIELVRRSIEGENLFDEMDEFVLYVEELFPRYVEEVVFPSLEAR